jgi:hypothetical protein
MNKTPLTRRKMLKLSAGAASAVALPAGHAAEPAFGADFPMLETLTTGEWWLPKPSANAKGKGKAKAMSQGAPKMDVTRHEVIAFALYTVQSGVLKLTAQLFPLKPDEVRKARLEVKRDDQWQQVAEAEVLYPGWDAHFRVEQWDHSSDVEYRVRHAAAAEFSGLIRKDPRDKEEIVVANMSCNSSRTTGHRDEMVQNLKRQNPDLLFFGGDQTYRHTEHTAGWIEFGLQFREVMKDRPTVCIPDDHDVGHGNLWGQNGAQSKISGDADGGYRYPVAYVNQVQRQQSWHLPDAVDPAAVDRDISVYFTRMNVGGVDLAILEDRKFKSGPAGRIPQMGPRPDHINDPSYDPKSIDLPGLELLGARQEKFLEAWTSDWTHAEMKSVLSATAFCGAVHIHGTPDGRLLADLDCNGWPQTPRNRALEIIRRGWAVHLCGDQHLAVVVKHGITEDGDGPYGFTSPALVNTIYHRWWHPLDEKPGANAVADSPLPWTGDFKDGLGNRIRMMAYANPVDTSDEKQRSDGYGIARFHKAKRTVTFECWPRFCDVREGDRAQFPGWPITVSQDSNDGRKVVGYLQELKFTNAPSAVVQVATVEGEVLYTVRTQGNSFRPRVYAKGKYVVRVGKDKPEKVVLEAAEIVTEAALKEVTL